VAVGESSLHNYELLDPDVRLMLQVRDDDAGAFEELVLRYQNRLVAIMRHLVASKEQAEDLAQEVFLRVYRARKRYTPDAKFSTWLFRIANNVASNANRSLARRREVTLSSQRQEENRGQPLDQMALAASGTMPARRLDKVERAEIVREAVESLSDRQRMALLLSKFEGLSYADIAQSMGLSIQATKSLLSRARENLREILKPYMQEGLRPSEGPSRGT
jgi:RNA polymerase sigma-70 factor (ECF subfamily)